MKKNKKIPLRRCVGCGEMKPKSQLLRVVKTPDEDFLLDETGKTNGRGAYLCKSSECCEMVVKSKGFQRSFKCDIPTEIFGKLAREIDIIEKR